MKMKGGCEVCGQGFVGTRRRRYCSNPCNQRAGKQRQKEQRSAADVPPPVKD
jgi:hypothetical protein